MRASKTFSLRTVALAAVVILIGAMAPAIAAGTDAREQRNSIFISKNSQFNAAHGVRSGSGTVSDPYVISGWNVDFIEIKDTSKAVVVRDNLVTGQLVLDWIGPNVMAFDNKVADLRVNQNVPRKGAPTSGHIMNNDFGIVGQLRHYDGHFSGNTVDPAADFIDDLPFFTGGPVVAFDGFNGAHFSDNTIYGPVRAQLHGHHHSTGYGEHSHMHATKEDHDAMDHTNRWHQVFIEDNTIYSEDFYALEYTDTAHSANDRTANSEENEDLNKPHVHHTQIFMTGNKLIGSGIYVDVFNASDDRHMGTRTGLIDIRNNTISLAAPEDTEMFEGTPLGIEVVSARDMKLNVIGNRITAPKATEDEGDEVPIVGDFNDPYFSGIALHHLSKGVATLADNVVNNTTVGIVAQNFKNMTWYVDGFRYSNVQEPMTYDKSAGKPNRRS